VPGVQLAHADEAQVREIGAAVRISCGESRELRQMLPEVEGGRDQAFCEREKPFREERSRGPRTVPASLRKAWRGLAALAFSSCSRTIRPCGTPALRADSSSQSASS